MELSQHRNSAIVVILMFLILGIWGTSFAQELPGKESVNLVGEASSTATTTPEIPLSSYPSPVNLDAPPKLRTKSVFSMASEQGDVPFRFQKYYDFRFPDQYASQQRILLSMDSYPTEQPQWEYYQVNNPHSEREAFQLNNGILYQNTMGYGFQGQGANGFFSYPKIDYQYPYYIRFRGRLMEDETAYGDPLWWHWGFAFGTANGHRSVELGISTFGIHDYQAAGYPRWLAYYDATKFRDYRVEVYPLPEDLADCYLYIDGTLVASSPMYAANFSRLYFGDCSGGGNARAEIGGFKFYQGPLFIASLTASPVLVLSDGKTTEPVSFEVVTNETLGINLWVRDSAGQESRISRFETDDHGALSSSTFVWDGRLPDGTLATPGTWTVIASSTFDRKEAEFFIKKVDKVVLALGTGVSAGGGFGGSGSGASGGAGGNGPSVQSLRAATENISGQFEFKDPSKAIISIGGFRACPTCPWTQMMVWAPGYVPSISIDDPVGLPSGNYVWQQIDLTLKSRMSLVMARSYNSLDTYAGPFGRGWSSPFTTRLEIGTDETLFVNSDGERVRFTRDGDTWKAAPGVELKLSLATDTGYWTISHPYGSEWSFDATGAVIRMTNACCGLGAADAWDLIYDAQGHLQRVTNPAGQWFDFGFNPTGQIATITDNTGRTISYVYDQFGNLNASTDALGRSTTYEYDEDGFLTRVVEPGNLTTSISYLERKVETITRPDGALSRLTWDLENHKVALLDVAGTTHEYEFNASGTLLSYAVPSQNIRKEFTSSGTAILGYTNAVGNQITWNYGSDGRISDRTDQVGFSTVVEYDPRFRLPTKLLDNQNREWRYEWCQRGNLTSVTDPDGGVTRYRYDSHNNRVSEIDPKARETKYSYDENGNHLLAIIDPKGDVTSFTYDLRGNKVAIKNQLGQITRKEYDALDREVKSISADGRWIKTEYNANGKVAAILKNDGAETRWAYDGAGRTISETSADGAVQGFTFDSAGRRIAVTDPLGQVTRTEYDSIGRPVKTTRADGSTEETFYDAEGRVTSTRDALGNETKYEYDGAGRQVAVVDPLGNRSTKTYDLAGRLLIETDALGRQTKFEYDVNDRLVKTIFSDGAESKNVYDVSGRMVQSIDAMGNITSYQYNERGQQVRRILPNGAVFERVYNGMGHEIETIDPLGRRTVNLYDELGRPYKTVDPASGTTQRFYDPIRGLMVAEMRPDGSVSTTTYDLLERPVAESDPLGNIRRMEYDLAGRQTAAVDPLGRRSLSGFDSVGRETVTIDPAGRRLQRSYDRAGRLVSLTDGAGRIWRWEYDALGRVLFEIDPEGRRSGFAYDAVGNMVARSNGRGQEIRYEYDSRNRLTKILYPDAAVATFAYDLLGRELIRSGSAGAVVKTWDSVGNLLSETFQPWSKTWTYSYDLVGNRVGAIGPEGEKYSYEYDSLNRLVKLDLGRGSIIRYAYDPVGRLVRQEREGNVTTLLFDKAGRLLSMNHSRSNGRDKLIAERSYGYDSVGNRLIAKDESGNTTEYRYDQSDWLVGVTYPEGNRVSYSYNGAGDRLQEMNEVPKLIGHGRQARWGTETTTLDFAYDAGGRMTGRASDTFSYDPDGNLVQAVEGGVPTRYVWSSDNRLLRVERDLPCGKHGFGRCGCRRESSVEFESYSYLPNDWRRIARTTGVGDKVDERFVSVYEGQDESHEYVVKARKHGHGRGNGFGHEDHNGYGNGHEKGHCGWVCDRDDDGDDGRDDRERGFGPRCSDGKNEELKLVRQFVGGPGMDDLEAVKYHGRELNMLKDGLGSTIALTNKGGNAVARVGYDAWGNLRFPDKNGYGVAPCGKKDLDELLDRLDGGRTLGGAQHDEWLHGRHFAKTINPYLFTGRRFDSYSQLYQNRNRQYNPKVGRFTSRDPLGFGGGGNLWGYAAGNPVSKLDPLGLLSVVAYDSASSIIPAVAQRMLYFSWSDVALVPSSNFVFAKDLFYSIESMAILYGGLENFMLIGHSGDGINITLEVRRLLLKKDDVISAALPDPLTCGMPLRPGLFRAYSWAIFYGCGTELTGVPGAFNTLARVNTIGSKVDVRFGTDVFGYRWAHHPFTMLRLFPSYWERRISPQIF